MMHEHDCGAEIRVCGERTDFGGAQGYRRVFRNSSYGEIHHCPGCGDELLPALQGGELRCLEMDDAA